MKSPTYLKDIGLLFPTPSSKSRRMYCEYECFCGTLFIAQKYRVDSKHTKSCGCLRKIVASKLNNTHNMSKHPIFNVWSNMMQRCYNLKIQIINIMVKLVY